MRKLFLTQVRFGEAETARLQKQLVERRAGESAQNQRLTELEETARKRHAQCMSERAR
jgi:hypothetical protein